jgi:hypothetical protein
MASTGTAVMIMAPTVAMTMMVMFVCTCASRPEGRHDD